MADQVTKETEDNLVPDPADVETADEVIEVDLDELPEAVRMSIEQLSIEREEATGQRQRALADFANFQRRASENEARARHDGASTVFRALLPVLDHFDLALGQGQEGGTLEQFLGGIRMVRDEIGKALEMNGLSVIRPEIGDEFDPNRHAAMMRQPTADHEAGRIVMVMQVGYAKGDMVLRPASVAVAAPLESDETE